MYKHIYIFLILGYFHPLVFCYQGIGDSLTRTYLVYTSLPITANDAIAAGWNNITSCDDQIGIGYVKSGSAPSKTEPVILYFTSGGQISGIGVYHFGAPIPSLEKYWKPASDGNYLITVAFRSSGDLCSDKVFDEPIGTQVVINQGSVDLEIPLDSSTAKLEILLKVDVLKVWEHIGHMT